MTQRRSHISTRGRILIVAIAAIIAPTVLLSLFGLKLIRDQQTYSEERLLKLLRTSAEVTVRSVVEQVKASEEDLLQRLNPNDINALEHLEKTEPLAEQAFLLSADDRFLFPTFERPAYSPPRAGLPADDEITVQGFINDGWHKEFVEKDLPAALESYVQCSDLVLEWCRKANDAAAPDTDVGGLKGERGAAEAAQAINRVASCLFKMGKLEEALGEYAQMATSPIYQNVAFRHSVLARYQIGQVLLKLGRTADAVSALLELYDILLSTKPRAGDGPVMEYFTARVIEDFSRLQADTLVSDGGVTNAAREQFDALRNRDIRRRQRREFLRALESWWQYKRKLPGDESAPAGEIEHVDGREFGMETSLVALKRVKLRAEDPDYSLVGFKLNLNHVIEAVASQSFQEDFSATAAISVLDQSRRAIFGPQVQGDRHDAIVPFPEPFKFWSLCVTESDPDLARKMARKLTMVYTTLNVLIVCVIVGGVYLTLKDMSRELEVTKMKSDFVSNVSHELKTPLALIRMFSETLLMGRVKDDARRQEYYDVITRESERLTALINNVLDFSKIDAGRRTYEMEPASVDVVIRNTLGAYRYDLAKEDFDVTVEIEPELPSVVMDDDAISQALLNLLNNAVKYSGRRKKIAVRAWRNAEQVHISVADSGIGISKDDQKKIFDMFYRAGDESVRAVRGTGLGLAITRHTAEAHGGTVTVESGLGEGSTFTIVLPIRQKAEKPG